MIAAATSCSGAGGRGCACAYHTAKRPRAAAYARQQRAKKLAVANATSNRCQRQAGPSKCNARFETKLGAVGESVTFCPACERRKAGICRDCSRRVEGAVGRAMRCAEHKELARIASIKASAERNHDALLEKSKKYYQDNPEVRARRNEYKKAYRKANPEKVREYKRKEALRQGKHRLEWHRRHNKKKARILRKRQQAMLAYYRDHPERPVPKCAGCTRFLDWHPLQSGKAGRPPKWCDDCAPKSEQQRRARNGTSVLACDERPLIAHIPTLRELERKVGPRTCVTDGCDIVVTSRKKKCSKCKAATIEEGKRLLAAFEQSQSRSGAPTKRATTRSRRITERNTEYEALSNRIANGVTIADLAHSARATEDEMTATLQRLGGDLLDRAYGNSRTQRPVWWTTTAVAS